MSTTVPKHNSTFLQPLQPHHVDRLRNQPAKAMHIEIDVHDPLDHRVPAILHEPAMPEQTAVILVSGAGGGVSGPGGIYPSLATKLATLFHIPVLRLDYRKPARNAYCVPDIHAGMDFLRSTYRVSTFVLIGWSFGGAPVFTVGSGGRKGEIAGVATVASQTAETSGIRTLAPIPVLFMHGTGDRTLSYRCSTDLFTGYGTHPEGNRELKLFDGDDHGLTKNSEEVEQLLLQFAVRCCDVALKEGGERDMKENLIGDEGEEILTMQEGHDLDNGEHL